MSLNDESTSPFNTLPPIICANQHEKVLAEQIPIFEIVKVPKEKLQTKDVSPVTPLEKPFPSHPLWISWSPDELVFEIDDEPIVQRLWVWNRSFRSIYVHCCDIWDEMAYSGAKWCCYPQTRFLLAPGIMGEMFIRASPKDFAPVPCALGKLQLAAAHMRASVTGFFAVPINVKFLKHVPYVGEGG